MLSYSILSKVGLSSLSKLSVTSVSVVVEFTSVPKVSIIVSISSTLLSSSPLVEIVTVPVVDPAAIFIGLSLIMYSSVSVAVPETVKGISIGFPLTLDNVAVKVTSVEEFSSIEGELKAKVTDGGSLASVIVTVETVVTSLVAFVTVVLGVIIIVSSYSKEVSTIEVKATVPVVSPAVIVISGFIFIFWTLWFSVSAT